MTDEKTDSSENHSAYPKWRRLEDLVHEIQEALSPESATVEQNIKVEGKSGVLRQIDVAVRMNVGSFPMFIVIDAKDYKDPVDIGEVAKVIHLCNDVGANQGVIVSPRGFTDGGRKAARDAGITLRRPVDTGDHDWKATVRIPTLATITCLEAWALQMSYVQSRELPHVMARIGDYDIPDVGVYDDERNSLGTIGELVSKGWAEEKYPMTPGEHEGIPLVETETFVAEPDGTFEPLGLSLNLFVSEQMYFHPLPITEFTGYQDINESDEGPFISKGFTLAPVSPEMIENEWAPISSEDELGVSPVLRFRILAQGATS